MGGGTKDQTSVGSARWKDARVFPDERQHTKGKRLKGTARLGLWRSHYKNLDWNLIGSNVSLMGVFLSMDPFHVKFSGCLVFCWLCQFE